MRDLSRKNNNIKKVVFHWLEINFKQTLELDLHDLITASTLTSHTMCLSKFFSNQSGKPAWKQVMQGQDGLPFIL